jgi:hypothetical protein
LLPEAIDEFKESIPGQKEILPYLQQKNLTTYNIPLQIFIKPNNS